MSFSAAVADPQDLTRLGTTRLLEDLGAQVITDFEGGAEILNLLWAGELDLVVTEMSLSETRSPRMGGAELLRRAWAGGLFGTSRAAAVLLLTTEDDEDVVREAFRLGAAGYALKSDPLREIQAAVEGVLRGERVLSESLPERLLEEAMEEGTREGEAGASTVTAGASTIPSAGPAPAAGAGEGGAGEGGPSAAGSSPTNTSETSPSGRHHALDGRERAVLRLTAQGLTNKEIGCALSTSHRAVEECRQRIQEKLRLSDRVEMVRYAARSGLL